MAEIVIMGELLVEIMRAEEDVQLYETGKYFRGPFPSGAPGSFCQYSSKAWDIAHQSFSGVGNDDFGKKYSGSVERSRSRLQQNSGK